MLGKRFVLLEPLGEGGHALVWRARDRLMRTPVAVKVLRSSDLDRQRRFALEAEVLANLHHPNVVRAIARGTMPDGQPYMVLELVGGENLRTRLDADGPLPWREVIEIGIQVAAALTALHGRGVIHRDVKPGNLMCMTDDGGALVVKLIDFGVARLTEDWDERTSADATPEEPRRQTEAGVAIGTPGYMPLEAGLGPSDERFDVYSLGATLYELCTGRLPGIEPIRPLAEVHPECDAPADLTVVLAASLALEPSDRTQTAAQLGRALAAVRAAHPEHRPSPLFDGRYELLAVVGTGARGEAYHAHHRGGGHDVVLKVLRSAHPDDAQRFRREARLLAFLDHPGVPRFFDYGQVAESTYIAMARAPGVPAAKFCLRSDASSLNAVEVAHVGLQLAELLAHVHARGILHRDVNANNVLIDLQRRPKVTLLDFGCAALTEKFYSASVQRYLTPPEARVVIPDGGIETLPWAAPEARAGHGFTDRSDVYSLGLLLFRLLTGKMPTSKGQDQPVSPRVYTRACPEDLALAVLSALNPDPQDRPTAAQLVVLLEDVLAEDEEAPPAISMAPKASVRVSAPPVVVGSTRGWTQFMAATAEPANAGPLPGAPAVVGNGDVKVAPVQPREIVGGAMRTLDGPRAVAVAGPPWRGPIALAAVVLFVVIAVLWVRGDERSSAAVEALPVVVDRAPATPGAAKHVPVPAAAAVHADGGGTLPAMRDALDRVAGPLRDCARLAGGVLLVELKTAEHRERFAETRAVGEDSPAVIRCVDEVLAPVRFAPGPARSFTEEYIP